MARKTVSLNSFHADGEEWGTIEALSDRFGVCTRTLRSWLRDSETRTRRVADGRVRVFYPSSLVAARMEEEQNLPQAGPDGTFTADGEIWVTRAALSRKLVDARVMLDSLLRDSKTRQGRTADGRLQTFYPSSVERNLPQAGPDGTFTADGERWGTVQAINNQLGSPNG